MDSKACFWQLFRYLPYCIGRVRIMKNILFKETQRSLSRNPGQWLIGLLGLIAFFFVLFWLVKGLYSFLSLIAPVLLIITAILNYRVITGYVAMLWSVFKSNWLMGILGAILTVVGLPFVSGYLFVKAILLKKIDSIQTAVEKEQQGEYMEFEDLSEEPSETLILKEPEPKVKKDNNYDKMF